jgi:hypothetical protein
MIERIEVNIDGGLDVPLPRMVPVRQTFDASKIEDVTQAVNDQFQRPEVAGRIKAGQSIAIGAGSRGVANVGETVKAVVAQVKALGGEPFVFPAMGSHGGATAEGQEGVLATYGITEEAIGAPVRATMETVTVGHLEDGTAIYADRFAHEADGVILVNRIKPHTNFRAAIESGIVKMMTIGMGKIRGATELHTHGMDTFSELLPQAAAFIMGKMPFLFGLGLVENGYDETALLEAILPEQLFAREAELQAEAKRLMARIYFDEIDVLVIEEMGKNISGSGFDPNITGRNARGLPWDVKPDCKKIVVLDLTEDTHGNATGIGLADVITLKLFNKLDYNATYARRCRA